MSTNSDNTVDAPTAYDAMLGLHKSVRKGLSVTPQGKAALYAHDNASQTKKLKKLQKHGASPQTRAAATLLSKAKAGDPKAQKDVRTLHAAAAKGDPKAKKAVLRLQAVDKATRRGLYDGSHPKMDLRRTHHRVVRMGCDKC